MSATCGPALKPSSASCRSSRAEPFSVSAINDSQRRLTELGLFHRVQITELPHGEENTRDLLITIEEAPPTTVAYGGGFEIGRITVPNAITGNADQVYEAAPRASLEIGRRNLFGKNRSLNLFGSISLHPKGSVDLTEAPLPTGNTYGLTEYRVVGTYREPRLFDTPLDALVNVTIEQQIRSSFNYRRASASAQISKRLTRSLSATGSYQLQRTELLEVKIAESDPLIDRLFSTEPLRLSSFTGSLVDDTRDDQFNPRSGLFLSASGQIAAEAIGSQVGFREVVFHGAGISPAAAHQRHRAGGKRAGRSRCRVQLRGSDPRARALLRWRRHDGARLRARCARCAAISRRI